MSQGNSSSEPVVPREKLSKLSQFSRMFDPVKDNPRYTETERKTMSEVEQLRKAQNEENLRLNSYKGGAGESIFSALRSSDPTGKSRDSSNFSFIRTVPWILLILFIIIFGIIMIVTNGLTKVNLDDKNKLKDKLRGSRDGILVVGGLIIFFFAFLMYRYYASVKGAQGRNAFYSIPFIIMIFTLLAEVILYIVISFYADKVTKSLDENNSRDATLLGLGSYINACYGLMVVIIIHFLIIGYLMWSQLSCSVETMIMKGQIAKKQFELSNLERNKMITPVEKNKIKRELKQEIERLKTEYSKLQTSCKNKQRDDLGRNFYFMKPHTEVNVASKCQGYTMKDLMENEDLYQELTPDVIDCIVKQEKQKQEVMQGYRDIRLQAKQDKLADRTLDMNFKTREHEIRRLELDLKKQERIDELMFSEEAIDREIEKEVNYKTRMQDAEYRKKMLESEKALNKLKEESNVISMQLIEEMFKTSTDSTIIDKMIDPDTGELLVTNEKDRQKLKAEFEKHKKDLVSGRRIKLYLKIKDLMHSKRNEAGVLMNVVGTYYKTINNINKQKDDYISGEVDPNELESKLESFEKAKKVALQQVGKVYGLDLEEADILCKAATLQINLELITEKTTPDNLAEAEAEFFKPGEVNLEAFDQKNLDSFEKFLVGIKNGPSNIVNKYVAGGIAANAWTAAGVLVLTGVATGGVAFGIAGGVTLASGAVYGGMKLYNYIKNATSKAKVIRKDEIERKLANYTTSGDERKQLTEELEKIKIELGLSKQSVQTPVTVATAVEVPSTTNRTAVPAEASRYRKAAETSQKPI